MASEVVGGGGRSGGMGRMGGGVGGGRDGRGWVLRHQLQVGRAVVRHEIKIKQTPDPLSISMTHKFTVYILVPGVSLSKMLLLCYVIPLPDAEGSSLNLGEAFLRDSGGRDGRDQKEVLLPVREVLTDHSYIFEVDAKPLAINISFVLS